MRSSHMDIAPIAGALGAKTGRIDVAQDLDEAMACEIRGALPNSGIIFFHDHKRDRDRCKAFTGRFSSLPGRRSPAGSRSPHLFHRHHSDTANAAASNADTPCQNRTGERSYKVSGRRTGGGA